MGNVEMFLELPCEGKVFFLWPKNCLNIDGFNVCSQQLHRKLIQVLTLNYTRQRNF